MANPRIWNEIIVFLFYFTKVQREENSSWKFLNDKFLMMQHTAGGEAWIF
jgi:hypothetical protein